MGSVGLENNGIHCHAALPFGSDDDGIDVELGNGGRGIGHQLAHGNGSLRKRRHVQRWFAANTVQQRGNAQEPQGSLDLLG